LIVHVLAPSDKKAGTMIEGTVTVHLSSTAGQFIARIGMALE
jgi:hypothetical protein